MNVTLKLRYAHAPVRPPAAWWVPGRGAEAWLAELTAWRVPLDEARLLVVAQTVGGAVVLPGGNHRPAASSAAIPYAVIADRLLVPVEAVFDPPLTDTELAALLPTEDAIYVWHPTAGLYSFAEHEIRRVADLVAAPAAASQPWDAAQPGVASNQRLLSIEPTGHLSLEDIAQAGREDIGSRSIAGDGLPQAPSEPPGGTIGRAIASAGLQAASGAARVLGAAATAMAQGLGQLGKALGIALADAGSSAAGPSPKALSSGRGQQGPNWLARLAAWTNEQQKALLKNLDALRNRQLERLLHSLAESPDEGLKYALPLTATGAARGMAPPGGSLIERNIDFNISRLGGGGPVDLWNVPPEYSLRLAAMYRELANREISLGRHRRAAYILAELLGDLSSAAATLADGGHFRDAAVLYAQRLKQPLAAAKCLERGGLLTEAIALFEKLHEWETVGNLYQQLDQQDAATAAYRRAVQHRLDSSDRLAAARLLEEKLAASDEAYATLIAGWPGSSQAARCVDESFQLLQRQRWHDRAREAIPRLWRGTNQLAMLPPLAAALARVARSYPQDDVREAACEMTRQIVADRLSTAPAADTESLLDSLAALVPADRLLAGDCRRYQQGHEDRRRRKLAVPKSAARRNKLPRPVSWFRLPQGDWKSVATSGDEFYAAGLFRDWLLVVRGRWDGKIQISVGQPWIVPHEQRDRPIFLTADPRGLGKLFVHLASGWPQHEQMFPATDGFPTALRAGPHPGSTNFTEGICYEASGSVYLLETLPEEWTAGVKCYAPTLRLEGQRSFALSPEMVEHDEVIRPVPFYVRGNSFYLGLGATLISLRAGQDATTVHSTIRSFTGSAAHSRVRIIAACAQGGVILWGVTADSPRSTFAMDLAEPVVGLARGGWLVAATNDTIEVSNTQGSQLTWVGEVPGPGQPPIAVTPTSVANQFAIFTGDGLVTIYEVPSQ